MFTRLHRRLSAVPVWLLLIVGSWAAPTVGLLVESFRGRDDHASGGFWVVAREPGQLTLENYDAVLETSGALGMSDSLVSSFAIVVPATVLPIALAATAAYGFVFLAFRGRSALFVGTVALLAVPVQVAMIPLLATFANGAHLTVPLTERTVTLVPDLDVNAWGGAAAWLTQVGFALPFAIFLLHNAFSDVPRELVDSARIDGASHVDVFLRIVVPLSLPALASLAVLQFLWSWNDFLIPQVMMSGADPVHLPATVRLASIVGEPSGAGPVAAAAVMVQSFVPLAVFVALQRYIVRGLVRGTTS